MAIIHALIAALARSAGKVLNTIFGWATALLFGRVTDNKQIAMSVACFGSVLWIVAIIGMIFPDFAALALTAFVPNHDKYDKWIRLAMMASAVLIPFIVGASKVAVDGHRMEGKKQESKLRQLLDGWPYTIGLAITLLLMMLFAPAMKARMLLRRWRAEHIPVMVAPEDYLAGVNDLETALENQGYHVTRQRATWMLRVPTQVLSFFAAKQVKNMVADQLTVLVGPNFEVQLHPSDLIISGKEQDAARVRAVLARRLLFSHILMTWNEEANKIEKKMKDVWIRAHEKNANATSLSKELEQIDRQIEKTTLRYEEWEVLYRQYLHLNEYLLRTSMINARHKKAA